MQSLTVRYRARIPPSGFRWIYSDDEKIYHLLEPPDDWPEQEYIKHHAPIPGGDSTGKGLEKRELGLTEKFLLATTVHDYVDLLLDDDENASLILPEPELYLRFTSGRVTSNLIAALANKFGFLGSTNSVRVKRSESPELVDCFASSDHKLPPDDEYLHLVTQSASQWISMFMDMRQKLCIWDKLSSAGDVAAMKHFCAVEFNLTQTAGLHFRVNVDNQSQRPRGEILATSLEDLIHVQWGMAIAAYATHRSCSECTTWFAVHPSSGRPEKQFCSDACRMRAYRKRKAGVK